MFIKIRPETWLDREPDLVIQIKNSPGSSSFHRVFWFKEKKQSNYLKNKTNIEYDTNTYEFKLEKELWWRNIHGGAWHSYCSISNENGNLNTFKDALATHELEEAIAEA